MSTPTHYEALQKANLSLIADRIWVHGGDVEEFWDSEMRLQQREGGWWHALDNWLGDLGHVGDLHVRLVSFWQAPPPRSTRAAMVPAGGAAVHIRPEGRRVNGVWLYEEDVVEGGVVVRTRPANGIQYDAEGIPTARFRNGRKQDFSHMPLPYREEQGASYRGELH